MMMYLIIALAAWYAIFPDGRQASLFLTDYVSRFFV